MRSVFGNGTRTAALLAALLLAAGPAGAADGAGAAGEWLGQYTTARALGMGGAYVAVSDDAFGALWNPAGLALLDRNELRFENARLFEDTSVNGLSFALPGSRLPSLGVTMVALRSGEFQRTNELNDPLGTFSEGETAYLLTLAHGFGHRVTAGANLKVVQQSVEEFSGGGFGLDLGGIVALTPSLNLGLSIANLGGPSITLRDVSESYATRVRGGAALALLDGRGLVAVQVDHSEGLGARFHAGAEYWLFPIFALRAGADDGRGGGGLTYRFAPQYQLDYAASDQALGVTHRIGLSYRFGGFFASSRAEPEAFSPTGEQPVTRISLNARTKETAESWTLDVSDKSDALVRRFGGRGRPPAHIEWDGKDETGLSLPDGVYRYLLTVTDRAGRLVASPPRAVEISTGGPQVRVPVVSTP